MHKSYWQDRSIIALLQMQDKVVFEQLYDQFVPAIYSEIRKAVSDEALATKILTETFLEVYNGLPNFHGNVSILILMLQITWRKVREAGNSGEQLLDKKILMKIPVADMHREKMMVLSIE